MQLSAKVDPTKPLEFFQTMRKQITFANSQAVNQLALKVQSFTLTDLLPKNLILRSKGAPWQKPGNKFGFNIKFASKEKPSAVIGSQADWLKLQEEGGEKKVSGHRLAIPTEFWKAKRDLMQAAKKPRKILDLSSGIQGKRAEIAARSSRGEKTGVLKRGLESKTKKLNSIFSALGLQGLPFIKKMKGGKEGIFARISSKRLPIKMIFRFEDQSPIKPVLEFESSGKRIVQENYSQVFANEMAQAIASARQ